MRKLAVLMVLPLFASSVALADFTFPAFSFSDVLTAGTPSIQALTGAPADTYVSYEVSLDWSNEGTYSWSSEARFGLDVGYLADSGASPDGSSTADDVTLTWSGNLDSPYMGGSDPLDFVGWQLFNGTGDLIDWDNITVTLIAGNIPTPPPAFSGDFTGTPNTLAMGVPTTGTTIWDEDNPQPGLTDGAGESANGTEYVVPAGYFSYTEVGNEVGYRIEHAGGPFTLDLTGLATDLDLYLLDSTGLPANGLASSTSTSDEQIDLADLAAGTYYAAVDGYGSNNPGSDFTILYTPEPASLLLLVLGGLAIRRR